ETCRIPVDNAGYELVNKIRQVCEEYGKITTFRAYLDVPLDSLHWRPTTVTLHSELQYSGVTLVYRPCSGYSCI
ncbi:hypothetical protein BD410DRAFT_734410, partial [Rickenella mellea]